MLIVQLCLAYHYFERSFDDKINRLERHEVLIVFLVIECNFGGLFCSIVFFLACGFVALRVLFHQLAVPTPCSCGPSV